MLEMVGCSAPYRESIELRLESRGIDAATTDGPGITLVLCSSEERWADLETAVADPERTAIAVLPTLRLEDYIRALAAGAAGVVYEDTPSSVTADVITAATQGEVLLPRQAARSMAEMASRQRPNTDLDPGELELLRAVASGRTVVDLARELYFSERTVRRHLQSLYLKLGVRNRAEAIAAATRMGLVD